MLTCNEVEACEKYTSKSSTESSATELDILIQSITWLTSVCELLVEAGVAFLNLLYRSLVLGSEGLNTDARVELSRI